MTQKSSENISGFWTGVYDYPRNYKQPVPFNVILTEDSNILRGEIIEPNTMSPVQNKGLFASLSGTRQGQNINFLKTYEGVPKASHSLLYEGTLDASHTKIEGMWRSVEHPSWSGPFVMNRSSGKEERVEEKSIKELELSR